MVTKKENISNTVNQLRTAHNITQQELADAVRVTRQTISAIERGNYTPSVLLAIKIARYFKTPTEDVFSITT